MRIHSQNLNEKTSRRSGGSMFWHGRAWLCGKEKPHTCRNEIFHTEWLFGKFARDWALKATFGHGDSNAGLCLHACIPFVFSVYLIWTDVFRCKESDLGIASHNGSIWLYTFTDCNEWSRNFPWWKKSHSWEFPWTMRHHLTEVLKPLFAVPSKEWSVIWSDHGKKFMDSYDDRCKAQESVSETYDYSYRLKSGETQHVKAVIYVSRMTWRARWWPLIPIKKVSTSISVNFVDSGGKVAEVGEGTGSYKGGVTGTGMEMLKFESPLQCLRRMERTRSFTR